MELSEFDSGKYQAILLNTHIFHNRIIEMDEIEGVYEDDGYKALILKNDVEVCVDSDGGTAMMSSNEFEISLTRRDWHESDAYIFLREKSLGELKSWEI